MELENRLLFPVFHPEVAGNGTVVLVHFAVSFLPVKVLALRNADPFHDLLGGRLSPAGPVIDVVDDGVSRVMGNPRSS